MIQYRINIGFLEKSLTVLSLILVYLIGLVNSMLSQSGLGRVFKF